eukprot:9703841-Alexandrium_andersonii.AAC.1
MGLGWRGVRMCDLLCSSGDRRRGHEAPGANERAAHAENQGEVSLTVNAGSAKGAVRASTI